MDFEDRTPQVWVSLKEDIDFFDLSVDTEGLGGDAFALDSAADGIGVIASSGAQSGADGSGEDTRTAGLQELSGLDVAFPWAGIGETDGDVDGDNLWTGSDDKVGEVVDDLGVEVARNQPPGQPSIPMSLGIG